MSRSLAIFLGLFALIVAPCAPAFAAAPACTMPGCEESPFGSVSSAACCCEAAGAPAQGSGQTPLPRPHAKVIVPVGSLDAAPAAAGASPLVEVAQAPPTPVPLFLLNSSLLI